jgi:serine/threonine protein kinase
MISMEDKTSRVSPTDHVPLEQTADQTTRVKPGEEATKRVAPGQTRDPRLPLGVLDPGSILCEDCVVERTIFPHESQRPGVYLCHAPEGRVVVKIAPVDFPPRMELWQRLPTMRHPNLLRTYRVLSRDGHFFDVEEFCGDGTLDDRVPKPGLGIPPPSPEWVSSILIPQMQSALQYLHAQDIVHRDLKPANIFVMQENNKERLILADFDISSLLTQNRTSRDTQRAAGTWLYTAPEAFPRFLDNQFNGRAERISRSNDYYALGITIIELLVGTTSLHLCQLPDLFDFYLQGGRVEIPSSIPGRLALLLRGLLIRNRHARWGADEVERWLRDKLTDDDLSRIKDDEAYDLAGGQRPYRINGRLAINLSTLADVMWLEQEMAKEDLITSDVLLNWIGLIDPELAREVKRDRDQHYLTPDLVLYNAIQRCDPTRPFIFPDGKMITTTAAWISHADQLVAEQTPLESWCSESLFLQLESWLRLKEKPESAVADTVTGLRDTPLAVRLEELSYILQPTRPFAITPEIVVHTPKELVAFTYGTSADWQGVKPPLCYELSYLRWRDGALYRWLRQRGLDQLSAQCEAINDELRDHPRGAFETILRLLDPELPPVLITIDRVNSTILTVPYGQQRTITLHYLVRGCGMPFGALVISTPVPGVQLTNPLLNARSGEVALTIDTHFDQQALKIYQASLILESGVAELQPTPITIRYRVDYPKEITLRRLILGFVIGFFLLSLPRFVLARLGERRIVSLANRNIGRLWNAIIWANYPLRNFIIAFVILAFCVYVGLRIWFRVLRNSEI